MSVTSDEVNVLVYRYLLESGFSHSAFSFAHEAHLAKAPMALSMDQIAPGMLVAYIQKGLQFDEIEAHVNEVSCIFLVRQESLISVLNSGWN